MKLTSSIAALLALSGSGAPPAAQEEAPGRPPAAPAELVQAFREAGIRFEPELGLCAIEVRVGVREDLLEYLLVHPHGASHESLFLTEVSPRLLNAAFLALGVQPGRNARWIERDPPPTREEVLSGVRPYRVEVPEGDGFYLYAAWRDGEETYFYRAEDLIRNLATGRAMERHRWVYLGSKTAPDRRQPGREVFAAELEGNLVNVAFFEAGYTLLTGALADCDRETIWLANSWLLPERGEPVLLVFAREKLAVLPERLRDALPRTGVVPPRDGSPAGDGEGR